VSRLLVVAAGVRIGATAEDLLGTAGTCLWLLASQ
jgi:hypothetical protein